MSGSKVKQLREQMASLQSQLEEARKAELPAVVAQIKSLMQEYSVTPEDLGFRTAKAARAAPLPPKYRHPESGAEWNGKGRAPVWAKEAREAGTLESWRIAPPVKARRTAAPASEATQAAESAVKTPATKPTVKKAAAKGASAKKAPAKKASAPKAAVKKAPAKSAAPVVPSSGAGEQPAAPQQSSEQAAT